MKLVLFQRAGSRPTYGLLRDDAVVPVENPLEDETPQEQLARLIESFEQVRARSDEAVPLADVRLLPPVPSPGKIVVTTAVYGPGTEKQQLLATLKSAESVVGPDDTVRLPAVDSSWQFLPQAMLGLVIRGPAKDVTAEQWQRAIFGYTCFIDVMAQGDQQFGRDYWLAKADTLGPVGPCIVTADEIVDVNTLHVRAWHNAAPTQDFAIADASHSLIEQVQFVTTVMTLHTGDVVACGTSPHGRRAVADGDRIEVEIDAVGRLAVKIGQAMEVRV